MSPSRRATIPRAWSATVGEARRILRRKKHARMPSVSRDVRLLRNAGALRFMRRVTESNEPEDREITQLLDPASARLVMSTELDTDDSGIGARAVQGVLGSAGLLCRSKAHYLTKAELVETWEAFDRAWPKPRKGGFIREVITSFDDDLLDFYLTTPLSTSDYPPNSHPVLSALFLGYPLKEIVGYYSRIEGALKPRRVERELEQYQAFAWNWGRP